VFVPLHIHTSYSFLQSGFTIERLLLSLKEHQFTTAAIADIDVLFGVPEFFTNAKKQSIKPIVGLELLIDQMHAISLFAIDELGYLNLCQLSTIVSKTPISFELLKHHHEGLVLVYHTRQTKFKELALNDSESAQQLIQPFIKLFKAFYLGVEWYAHDDDQLVAVLRKLQETYSLDLVAFPLIKYPKANDALVLDILNAISKSETLIDKEKNGPYHFEDVTVLKTRYSEQELANTLTIASLCKFEFMIKRGSLLKFPIAKDSDATTTLRMNAIEGLQKRPIDFSNIEYFHRLDNELKTINDLGFSDYFLIVADFVQYAKTNAITVGPGRGSAPGSLVAYALGITEIDPIQHQLLFERFLNPSRKNLPDIDIDFADIDREKIVNYLRQKYDTLRVANIITFQTIQAKQAIRDIGRVYQYSSKTIDLIAKTLTDSKLDLRGAYKHNPAFKSLFDSDSECAEVIKLAHKIEGFVRQSGLHPAGVVLNQNLLQDALPLIDNGDFLVTQYEMNYLEPQGFLKIDLLGLRNLTTVEKILQLVKKNHNVTMRIEEIPTTDSRIFDLLRTGHTLGIFQLETEGMRKTIKELNPKNFDDIVAILALYRPGPMDNIKSYIARKEGKESFVSLDPQLNEVLNPTFGIIVYQEQIMKIAQIMAGFSLSKADDFRRSISKKDVKTLESLRESFLEGAVTQGYKSNHALSVFNHIMKFADYGFNKSHSVAYATLSCQMAYLKAVYPHEFFASVLDQTSFGSDGKFASYLDELRAFKIQLQLPHINYSSTYFVSHESGLLFPLSGIKGLPKDFIKSIIEERELNGLFDDIFDFTLRMYQPKFAPVILEKLIDAGAFDTLHSSRASLRISIPNILLFASVNYLEGSNEQGLIDSPQLPKIALAQVSDDALTNLEREKEVLGLPITGQLKGQPRIVIPNRQLTSISDIKHSMNVIQIGGYIKSKKVIKTKNNDSMAFITLMDDSGTIDIVVFPKLFTDIGNKLEKNILVVVFGKFDESRGKNFIADKIEIIQENKV